MHDRSLLLLAAGGWFFFWIVGVHSTSAGLSRILQPAVLVTYVIAAWRY